MSKFRRKPIEIEATRFNKYGDHPGVKRAFFAPNGNVRWVDGDPEEVNISGCRWGFYISTLDGGRGVAIGDWIIQGTGGELYPCKPDIFEATYDPV